MKTHDLAEAQRAAWDSYQRMRIRLTDRLNQHLAQATGLSEADFEILVALTESPQGSARALALRCCLEWEKSRLSHQLRRMEQRGLVVREQCTEDNRGAVVRLTETGRKLAEDARRIHDHALQRYVFDVLSPQQLGSLGDIAATILANLDEPARR